ncbi:hypothetical protein ABT324_30735, partial [Saccharopolyspora sp. NPDC000359]|uniref:hypothetical protein n=1 Tax=Saccharopolyspora sp. NPDC000359 TaxID=3154251 RepID=UPI0033256127
AACSLTSSLIISSLIIRAYLLGLVIRTDTLVFHWNGATVSAVPIVSVLLEISAPAVGAGFEPVGQLLQLGRGDRGDLMGGQDLRRALAERVGDQAQLGLRGLAGLSAATGERLGQLYGPSRSSCGSVIRAYQLGL